MFKNINKLSLAIIFLLCATIGFAQEATEKKEAAPSAQPASEDAKTPSDPSREYSEADRPEDNYLARFHARDRVEYLMKDNLDKIFTLNVITTNFKSKYSEWQADYDKVYKGYKKGVDLYYRRNLVYSRVTLEANKKEIDQFYKKISEAYEKETMDLLSLCADNILELTLDAKTSSDPDKNRILFNNKSRVRIAYGQIDSAKRMYVDHSYHTSIFHYRVAKMYAIKILEGLNPKAYRGKYDLHKADNKNRIMTSRQTTAPEAKTLNE